MPDFDLTPFGFTPTEGRAYRALLVRGPSSGYGVGKALSIARANAYHALAGLVSKGAAVEVEGSPRRFRAIQPSALLALVTQQVMSRLDDLEKQVDGLSAGGAPAVLRLGSDRAFRETLLRTAARATTEVVCLAPALVLSTSLPLWRKRAADRRPTRLWAIGLPPDDYPLPLEGAVPPDVAAARFGHPQPVLLLADTSAVIARVEDGSVAGYWASEPILVGAARAAIAGLIGATGKPA